MKSESSSKLDDLLPLSNEPEYGYSFCQECHWSRDMYCDSYKSLIVQSKKHQLETKHKVIFAFSFSYVLKDV